jgi:hypothetical protein
MFGSDGEGLTDEDLLDGGLPGESFMTVVCF